jgi:hypothetical protein
MTFKHLPSGTASNLPTQLADPLSQSHHPFPFHPKLVLADLSVLPVDFSID